MARPKVNADVEATKFVPVVKADATNLPDGAARALWVGSAGTANLVEVDGTQRADVPLKEGLFPCAVLQVETGGTADDIWAIY